MTKPLVIVNVVGLTAEMIGPETPNLLRLARDGFCAPMSTVFPAVTCTAQASLLTGTLPREHGIVANGWYFRDLADVLFWRQSNRLMQGEKLYEAAKKNDPHFTTAKMFWWYNMYANVDWSVTPRPCYPADGRKVFDSYSQPAELKDRLQERLGVFPLRNFWGPTADIRSSTWIANASCMVLKEHDPSLLLVYLPHLDYNLQRLGPNDPQIKQDLRLVDKEAGKVIDAAQAAGREVIVLSEYAITEVHQPVSINRILREHGYLSARKEIMGWETLDFGASRAFAVADHQIAHIYLQHSEDLPRVKKLLESENGIERVLDLAAQKEFGLNHERSGELVAVAQPQSWFTYYFWLDDGLAPDYARTVDIHRKPGYDPVELFLDPAIRFPKARIVHRLIKKKLGFRYYMDVIGLDARIVKGSHGRLPTLGKETSEGPVFLCSSRSIERDSVEMTDVKALALNLQFGG